MSQPLGFLLEDFKQRAPGVQHVIALSMDGILVARDASLTQDSAERLAAATSGLMSLLKTFSDELGVGACSHNLTEYRTGFVLTMGVQQGGAVLAFAETGSDLGQVSFELAELVGRVGDTLAPAGRHPTPAGQPR